MTNNKEIKEIGGKEIFNISLKLLIRKGKETGYNEIKYSMLFRLGEKSRNDPGIASA